MKSKHRGMWWVLLLGCPVLLAGGGDVRAQREGNRAAAPAEAESDTELATRTYQVSPTFLDSGGGDGATSDDPFASDAGGDGKALRRQAEAKQILERAGVHFGKGASAVYQPDNSLLVVCNTPDQLQLVEAFVEALAPVPSVHLHIKATFVTSRERLFGEQEGLPEPKVSGPENATYNIEEPGDLVKLLEQTNLSNAVANARSRVFQPRTQMAGGTPVAVLTTDEVEARFKKLRQAGQAMIIDGTGGRLASGSGSLLIHADDRGVGIASGVVAADCSEVWLEIVSQGPQIEGQGERRLTTTSMVIADGHTVVLERRLADELYEYDFITARIHDAVGNPVDTSGEQEEVAAESAGSPAAVEETVELPSAADLYTNVYQVPPTFLDQGVDSSGNDPFASGEEKGSTPKRRPTARELLERAGVQFPEEGSARYDPSTSQLIVRNTLDQMELVEAYIESTVKQVEVQVYVTTLFAESDEALFASPAEVAAEQAAEPNRGSLRLESSQDLAVLLAAGNIAAAMEEHTHTHLLPGISGVFTDPQLEVLRKRFAEEESASLSGGGNVMLRSGQGGWLLSSGDRAVGVKDVTIGADGFTIELSLYFQGGAARGKDKREVNEVSITIWDGQTVMVERELPKGRFQYDFVTARLKDPAGMNIHGDEFPAQEVPEVELPSASVSEEDVTENVRRVKEADQAALRGNQQMAEERPDQAQQSFLKALRLLPDIEETEGREKAYLQQWLNAMRAAKAAQ